jgi:hypothetical protein
VNLRRWLALSVMIGGMGYGFGVRADAISLNSGSEFGASADNVQPVVQPAIVPVSQTIPVTSLPYTGTASVTGNLGDTSTTGATLSTSSFAFTFNQSVTNEFGDTDGFGDMFFTANANVSYSIAGFLNFLAPDDSLQGAELYMYLDDLTHEQTVFTYDNFLPAQGSATASGDGITGTLVAGDSYEFYVDENMNVESDPTVTGNASITFGSVTPPGGSSTPLPSGLAGGLLAIVFAVRAAAWQRRQTA